MPKPFMLLIKYEGDVYILRDKDFDNLQLADPQSNLATDKFAFSRTEDWKNGLFVGLEAAVAFHDQAGFAGDSGGLADDVDAGLADDDDDG